MEKKNVTRVAFIAAAMTLITLGLSCCTPHRAPGIPNVSPAQQ